MRQVEEQRRGGGSLEVAMDARAAIAREHEERRHRRGETDVNYGAAEEQVPAHGWIP